MELVLSNLVTSFVLPPMGLVVLGVLGVGISLLWRKLGVWVAAMSLLGLLLCSMPVVSASLLDLLQTEAAIPEKDLKKTVSNADAVVLLSAGRRYATQEYGGDTVSEFSLERVRYAAWITKRTGLPLIVSGGRLNNETRSLAELMRDTLQKEFVVIVDHVEGNSRNTYENAKYTTDILHKNRMKKIVLVTHAWHMPRAKKAFESFGIKVIPAPTAFYGHAETLKWQDFLPSASALMYSSMAFHELFGAFWYDLRYY